MTRIPLSIYVRLSSQIESVIFVFKISIDRLIQNGEISKVRETPSMMGDNGLYLLMIRVMISWCIGPGPTCTKGCLCLIYRNYFAMSWS